MVSTECLADGILNSSYKYMPSIQDSSGRSAHSPLDRAHLVSTDEVIP